MGLHDEYDRARAWIRDHLTFDVDGEYNTFEVSDYTWYRHKHLLNQNT